MPRLGQNRNVPALTGIRFFAASYVFVMHFGATFLEREGVPRPVATLLHNGGFGVSVFFVLSGFILSHAHAGQFATAGQLRDYFIARFARIYPVYFFALVLALPVSAVTNVPLTAGRAAAVLGLVQSWTDAYSHSGYAWITQAWTLSVELFFYLLFPFTITWLRRLGTAALVLLSIADAAFMVGGGTAMVTPWVDANLTIHVPVWPLSLFLPLVRSGEFFFGMLMHTLVSRSRAKPPRLDAALYLVAAAILALLSLTRDGRLISVATLCAGVLIALLYIGENKVTRVLGSRVLEVLGCASYAFYLLQQPVHEYLLRVVPDPYDRLLAFPVTVAASLLVWRLVEEPARRGILALRPRAAAPVAAAAGQERAQGD